MEKTTEELNEELNKITNEVEYAKEGKKASFEGIVRVYDETFYVNTETGVGLGSVLKKIEPLLNKMSSKTYIAGYTFEDIKQELTIMAIQGVCSYNPAKGTKLSSFLQTHLKNKLISKLRSVNKMSNDSFALYEKNGTNVGGGKIRKVREEILFSSCTPDNVEDPSMMFENTVSEEEGLYGRSGPSFADKDFELALQSLEGEIDEDTITIMKLIYYEDYPIKKAAEAVGLTGWAASMRLKKLTENECFMNAFGDIV